MLDVLRDIIENTSNRNEILLLGDLNATVGNRLGDNIIGRFFLLFFLK